MNHPSDEELSRYSESPEEHPNRAQIDAHLAKCSNCREVVQLERKIVAGLRVRETWRMADDLLAPDMADSYAALIRSIPAEDVNAERLLSPLVAKPLRFIQSDIASNPIYRTGGAVRFLCNAANRVVTRQPTHALDLANAAATIATAIPDGAYPFRLIFGLRGNAWKERANALRFLGRHGEALTSLQRAEQAFREQRTNGWGLGVVQYVRATVYRSAERYEEARALAREAGAILEVYGDVDRSRAARLLEAACLQRLGQLREAKALYEIVLRGAEEDGDVVLIGSTANNLGDCQTALGEFDAARRHIDTALAIFGGLDSSIHHLRTQWTLARLLAATGNHTEALATFVSLKEQFLTIPLEIEAALIDLDRVDILVSQARYRDVKNICAALVAYFEEAGLFTSALMALAYLKEAAESESITRRHVAHVREFIDRTREHPQRLFSPLPDETTFF